MSEKLQGRRPREQCADTWSETNNAKWKVKIPGIGHATPIIWDNWVFIQAAIPTGKKVKAKPAKGSEQAPAVRPEADGAPPKKEPAKGKGPGRLRRRWGNARAAGWACGAGQFST